VSEQETPIVFSITPEPSPEELAAIVAALTTAVSNRRAADVVSARSTPTPSRWSRQGRRDAMRGLVEVDDDP